MKLMLIVVGLSAVACGADHVTPGGGPSAGGAAPTRASAGGATPASMGGAAPLPDEPAQCVPHETSEFSGADAAGEVHATCIDGAAFAIECHRCRNTAPLDTGGTLVCIGGPECVAYYRCRGCK